MLFPKNVPVIKIWRYKCPIGVVESFCLELHTLISKRRDYNNIKILIFTSIVYVHMSATLD